MKSATELTTEIIKITLLIEEKYPELYEHLREMPITIPMIKIRLLIVNLLMLIMNH